MMKSYSVISTSVGERQFKFIKNARVFRVVNITVNLLLIFNLFSTTETALCE